MQEDLTKISPYELESEFKQYKIPSITLTPGEDSKRLPYCDFLSNETRLENSLKYLPIWIEAFIITSITMTFGQILNRVARKRLADGVKERYETVKGDLATYQKAKKKL